MKFYKNFRLVVLLATMMALGAQATPVSSVEVCRAVSAWAAANGSAFANLGSVDTAEPVSENGTNLYWVVKMTNGGAVIASPDTNIDLVIAVLEKYDGGFPAGHPLPSILKRDMLNRLSVIGSCSASGGVNTLSSSRSASTSAGVSDAVKASVGKANAQWEKYKRGSGASLLAATLAGGDSSPFVRRIVDGFEAGGRFTHWNQGAVGGEKCYNYYTPGNMVCGCVATAGAAVMQFFGCTEDVGEQKAQKDTSSGEYSPSADFSLTTIAGAIDWSILPADFGGEASVGGLDEAGRELLGRVTYNLGVLVGMDWGEEGSGAYLTILDEALKAQGFSSARYVRFDSGDSGADQYFKTVYAQNWAGAPVVLGISGEPGGHAVVACGYAKTADEEDFCRVFMGWGGNGDGWYRFPGIDEFNVVDNAVTMLGYVPPADSIDPSDFDFNDYANKAGTIPVCGRANVTNCTLKFPGVTQTVGEEGAEMSFTLTTSVDSNGYFAVRIPADTKDLTILHKESGTTALISPFDSKVLTGNSEERLELEAAMPAEMAFLVLNMTVKFTVESARETALRDGKALLMVSGAGSMREQTLLDYVTWLDSTTDMSNRFVFVRVNSADATSIDGDGDPSIGVFNPADGAAELRWWEANGRLAYENFIDADASFDELTYTFTPDNTEALTNSVTFVLSTGYDTYLRQQSGISVTVRAFEVNSGTELAIAGLTPTNGIHENCWTNGEVVVFSAPLVYTNETSGISYSCIGWSTNYAADVEDSVKKGNQAELSLATSNNVVFSWVWSVKEYRVTASEHVTPDVAWRVPGDRVTLVAEKSIGDGVYGLSGWAVSSAGVDYDLSDSHAAGRENGSALSFTVLGPVSAEAKYSKRAAAAADPKEYKVELSMEPAELADLMNDAGALGLGENSTYDLLASLVAQTSDIVDSTGGVWKCVGWVEDGVTNAVSDFAALDASAVTSIELVWELQEPEIVLPEPGDISITSISRSDDGKWIVTVSGAVKDCWYWLYASDDLSKLAGASDAWTADVAAKVQATEDGEISFEVSASGASLFWRARATATETGE